MSLTLTDHRRSRGSAKGTITKVARESRTLCAVTIERLDVTLADKQLELLDKADEVFKAHHQAIYEADDDVGDQQHLDELSEHQTTVGPLREVLQGLRHRHEASVIVTELALTLDDMELSLEDGYSVTMDHDMDEAQSLSQRLRQARSKPEARECLHLKTASDQALRRLRAVQKTRETARAANTSEASDSPEVVTSRVTPHVVNSLKLKLPTFDGTVLKWRDFWGLYSTLIEKETLLSEDEKKCHLIQAMGTPESKLHAEDAVAYTESYDEAVKRLKDIYELNRVLQAHHLADLFRSDLFKDDKRDMTRMMGRLEKNIRGIKLAKGYSLDQAIATYYEGLMSPTLVRSGERAVANSMIHLQLTRC